MYMCDRVNVIGVKGDKWVLKAYKKVKRPKIMCLCAKYCRIAKIAPFKEEPFSLSQFSSCF